MSNIPTKSTIKTKRLILRPWKKKDLAPLIRLNTDTQVMEFLLGPLTHKESAGFLKSCINHIDKHGWGLWAVSAPHISDFIGWIGLSPISLDADLTPAIEVAWRLLPKYWGQGYATEGANAALQYGFGTLKLDEIIAITVPANLRSRRVMNKLNMRQDIKGDFDHPKVPDGHPLKKHVLYRITASEWLERPTKS